MCILARPGISTTKIGSDIALTHRQRIEAKLTVPTLTFGLSDKIGATPAEYCRVKLLTLLQFSTKNRASLRDLGDRRLATLGTTKRLSHLEHEASRGLSGQRFDGQGAIALTHLPVTT